MQLPDRIHTPILQENRDQGQWDISVFEVKFRFMYAIIFANGDFIDGPAVRAVLNHETPPLIIAADGGLNHIVRLDLRPDMIIGDLDSAQPVQLQQARAHGVEVKQFPTDKDETDLELALIAAVRHDCDPIRIIGAVGDRLDQTLGNVYLLALTELVGRDVRMVNGKQTICLARPGETHVTGQPGDTLSLLPISGDVSGIVTEGLQYPLNGETLRFGPARGMSNVVLTTSARIKFKDGLLLLVHTVGRA